ncbi:MAG: biopolymer transporter ExbD [Planctomycetota bacterium]|jgi:biopolymer transport protein ExbD|nr:biopolymer transporter ExbD [Planctomycetota bacterium]
MAAKIPDSSVDLNMTPMIDVVFLLIIFFMLILKIVSEELTPLDLPTAVHANPDEAEEDRVIINLRRDGKIFVDGRVYDPTKPAGSEALKKKLAFEAQGARGDDGISERQILIRADRSTKYQHVEKILRLMVNKGIRMYRVQFGAEEDKKK